MAVSASLSPGTAFFWPALRALSFIAALGTLSLSLQGCASRQKASAAALRSVLYHNEEVDSSPLRPDLRYLRVTLNGKAMLMVLGYVDHNEHGEAVEVWYSGDGEVLRLNAGRLAGLSGSPVEWTGVRFRPAPPPWTQIGKSTFFVRHFDQMPGYLWNRKQQVRLDVIAQPPRTQAPVFTNTPLVWFEEVVDQTVGGALSPARYAMAPGDVQPLYGEQCLQEAFCLSWQRWPPTLLPGPK
ncbi:MAG: hypothetical protein QM742_11795 [Aquabacterium sp.]